MLKYIYLGSIVFYVIGLLSAKLEVKKQLKAKQIKEKPTSVRAWIQAIVIAMIPVVNVFFGFMLMFSNEVMQEAIKNSIKEDKKDESID